MELTNRQQQILQALISEYTRSAEPVSSNIIVQKYHLDVCPATIRAELIELEQSGYLEQPHTSAGRIPTNEGYRYFVNSLMKAQALSRDEMMKLQQTVSQLQSEYIRLARMSAKLLAECSDNVAITTGMRHNQKEVHNAGIKQIMNQPEFYNKTDALSQLMETLDYIEDHIDEITHTTQPKEVMIYIGSENPYKEETEDLSMILSQYTTNNQEQGLVAIIGPKRMPYARNVSLIENMTKLLSKGIPVLFIISTLTQAV